VSPESSASWLAGEALLPADLYVAGVEILHSQGE
jgi:hypothetical protein